jgi:hypothetical protein
MTVEQMIRLEVEHARHHLQEIDETLKQANSPGLPPDSNRERLQ